MIIENIEQQLNLNDLDENDPIIFTEQVIDFDKTCNFIQQIFDYEIAFQKNIKIYIKSLNAQLKSQLLKKWLLDDNMSNAIVLLNIINLIKTYNTLSDDYFSNDNIFFKDITELLDIKLSIKPEIDQYINSLATWYLSLFISVHKNESNYLDDVHEIPVSYKKLILSLDFYTLSGICQKAKQLDINGLKCVKDAYLIVSTLSEKNNLTMKLFDEIQKIS